MNTDFLKNITIPSIQLPKVPKFKTRKIFTSSSSSTAVTVTQRDTLVLSTTNLGPPKPKPLVVSPAKISTISSLVDGAPTYDYSFGGATLPDHVIDEIVGKYEEQEQQQQQQQQSKLKGKTPAERFSRKISKQYKELSEFKLKDIFGKKSRVVRTTEIPPSINGQQNFARTTAAENRFFLEHSDSNDDIDMEYQTGYDRYAGNVVYSNIPEPSLSGRRKINLIKQSSEESKSSMRWSFPKAASLQVLSGIKPNESSLWRIKKSKSKSSSSVNNAANIERKDNEDNKTTEKTNRIGKKTLSRRDFDAAFDKAKKSMNSKFRQLKFLQSRQTDLKDSKKTAVASPVEIIDRTGSFDSFDSETELPEANLRVLRDEWITGRIVSCEEIPRCLLGPQDSVEEADKNEIENEETIVSGAQVYDTNTSATAAEAELLSSENSIEELTDSSVNYLESHSSLTIDVPQKVVLPLQQDWVPNSQIIVAFYQANSSGPPSLRKSIFPEFPRGHSRKPSMDSSDSDSWVPEKLRGAARTQIALNKIDETYDSGAWQVNNKLITAGPRMIKSQSIDIFKRGGEELFEDFDTVLQNAPVIPVQKDSFDYEDRFYGQRSVEFSTTDDDEDDIEPDKASVVESSQELSKIQEMPSKPRNTLSSENVEIENNSITSKVVEEAKDEIKEELKSYVPQYTQATINKQFTLEPLKTSNTFTHITKGHKQSTYDKTNQNCPKSSSLIKQGSLRRHFTDELKTENLADVNVNKLISRFEKQKSSSSSTESLNQNQITVEAVIESKSLKIDSPISVPILTQNLQNTSSIISSANGNDNLTLTIMDQQQSSLESAMSESHTQTIAADKEIQEGREINSNNINNGHNGQNKMKCSRRKSLEWAKSSRTINRTIDIPTDKDTDGEIFYSLEYDEDSTKQYDCNNTSSDTTTIITSTTAITKNKRDKNNIRHIYSVAL